MSTTPPPCRFPFTAQPVVTSAGAVVAAVDADGRVFYVECHHVEGQLAASTSRCHYGRARRYEVNITHVHAGGRAVCGGGQRGVVCVLSSRSPLGVVWRF